MSSLGGCPKGKNVTVDVDHPEALAICDYSKVVHLRKDLVQQMEWRGDRLVWNGFLVAREYLDTPNPQLKTIYYPPDPVPIAQPRIGSGQDAQTPGAAPTNPYVLMQQLQYFNWNS